MRLPALAVTVPAVAAAAALGASVTDPENRWYRHLDKPSWNPPGWVFAPVWTTLYAGIAWAGAEVWNRSDPADRLGWAVRFATNLVLNGTWNVTFFGAHQPAAAAAHIVVLETSTVDLIRQAARVSPRSAALLVPYALWNGFAGVLSAAIARRNP